MQVAAQYEHVPLLPEETAILKTIYNKRFTFIIAVYIGLIGMGNKFCGPYLLESFSGRMDHEEYVSLHTTDQKLGVSPFQMILIDTIFIEGPIITTFFIFFFGRVFPYRRDIRSGVKERVPYTIVRKEYFPLTNEYYVALDDPDYMHHKIDEATYNQVNEGDNMYLSRAIHSKYVFEINGRFTIM